MALNGSLSVEATPNARDLLVFSWEVTAQDAAAQTSTVKWLLQLVADEYGTISGVPENSRNWTVTIDGTTYTGQNDVNIGANATKTLAEGTVTLAHEAGAARSFDFSFSQQLQITWSGTQYIDTVSGDGSGVIDAIAAAEPEEPDAPIEPEQKPSIAERWSVGYALGLTGKPLGCAPDLITTLGWLTGKRIASQRRKPPVGYLYGHVAKEGETPTHTINGVDYVGAVLPDINAVWTDKEKYPFAVAIDWMPTTAGTYALDLLDVIPCVVDGETTVLNVNKCATYACCFDEELASKYGYPLAEWFFVDDHGPDDYGSSFNWFGEGEMWVSHSVYYKSGKLAMEAIPPIPVYE